MKPCPNCGIAGNSFGCTNHIIVYENLPSVGLIVPPIDPARSEEAATLLAEIGRLHMKLKEADDRAAAHLGVLVGLQNKGIIDHLYRPLPLKGHRSDCPHGQGGWALCTCDRMSEGEKLDAALGSGRERPET